MIIGNHYDDDALLSRMTDHSKDEHLATCGQCRRAMDEYRAITVALSEPEVWVDQGLSDEPSAATILSLRTTADAREEAREEAKVAASRILASPRESWDHLTREHPEYRTAGVATALVDAATAAIDITPRDAVEISQLAVAIAEDLPPGVGDEVYRVRGAAWRERAYALFYTGRFADAAIAAQRADQAFASCIIDEYDRARVGIVRSLVDRALEREDALRTARQSAAVLARYGDVQRYASARMAETHQLFTRGEHQAAIEILEELKRILADSNDLDTRMRVFANLGYAYRHSGHPAEAMDAYQKAYAFGRDLGNAPEVLRLEWNLALVLSEAGQLDEARKRLEQLADAFAGLDMISESALVKLDLAAILLVDQRFAEVERLCDEARQSFSASGIPYAARALTALSYMQEAAQQRRATPTLARHVSEYLRQLPAQEQLLFIPPP